MCSISMKKCEIFSAKAILSYLVERKSPLEFRLNGIIGRMAECGFIDWYEDYSWFTINIAAFLPMQKKRLSYWSTNEQMEHSYETSFFTMDHLEMAYVCYTGMLALASFVFLVELIWTYSIRRALNCWIVKSFVRRTIKR